MSHYTISAIMRDSATIREIDNVMKAAGRENRPAFSIGGFDVTFDFKGRAELLAEMLSDLRGVERVNVTHIGETSCGVWRKGNKL